MHVGGNLSVGGTLTYEDVTNVDAIGFGTFRKGLNVQGTGSTTTTLNVTGVSTFAGIGTFGSGLHVGSATTTAFGLDVVGLSTFRGLGDFKDSLKVGAALEVTGGLTAASFATVSGSLGIADQLYHIGDSNTKIRFPAADTFSVETAGSERLRINSSGEIISYNGTLRRNVSDSSFTFTGDTASNTGSNVSVYGASHSTLASVVRFRSGATETVRITSSGGWYRNCCSRKSITCISVSYTHLTLPTKA